MKTTNLGKSEIQQTYFDCENLRDLMLAIESRMQESGEVVCQYVLNGMVLQEADEARMSGIGIEEIKNLEKTGHESFCHRTIIYRSLINSPCRHYSKICSK